MYILANMEWKLPQAVFSSFYQPSRYKINWQNSRGYYCLLRLLHALYYVLSLLIYEYKNQSVVKQMFMIFFFLPFEFSTILGSKSGIRDFKFHWLRPEKENTTQRY